MARVYLGIGSNLGDRAENCLHAVRLLGETGVTVTRQSSLYETEPWGVKEQPRFINMAVEIETGEEPPVLLGIVKRIEKLMGRGDSYRWGPRVIDIDILLYEDRILSTPEVTIPHPRMHEREFVLKPLAEIAPDRVHPTSGKSVSALLTEVSGS